MRYQLRPFAGEYTEVAQILSLYRPEPMTAQWLEELHSRFPEQGVRHQLVAEDETGAIVGYGTAEGYPWEKPGRFYCREVVALGARGRGIGSALVEANERFARQHGGVELINLVRDNDHASLGFARNRGFAVERHIFESTLDLTAFDASPFHGAVEATKASGIGFMTMAAALDDASKRKLWDLHDISAMDVPGIAWLERPPYEDFHHMMFESSTVVPEHIFVATDGPHYVGMTVLEQRTGGVFYTGYTGVDRNYRGRGIALALKVLAAEVAQQAGAPYMRTNNESTNAPMLAVNRKLGYQDSPGFYDLIKTL